MSRPKPTVQPAPPVVRVKPQGYQPSKAELEEPVQIDATPEELARAIMTPVRVVRDSD